MQEREGVAFMLLIVPTPALGLKSRTLLRILGTVVDKIEAAPCEGFHRGFV